MKTMKRFACILVCGLLHGTQAFAAGPVWEWARSEGGTGYDAGNQVAIDADGNLYLAAQFGGSITIGTNVFEGRDTGSVWPPAYGDAFLAKYDPKGKVLWARTVGAGCRLSFELDLAGNIYVAGASVGKGVFGRELASEGTPGAWRAFVAQLDANGQLVWATQADGLPLTEYPTDRSVASGIARNSTGHLYMTGVFTDQLRFGELRLTAATNATGNVFLAKFDPAGQCLWLKQAGTLEGASAGVVVDQQDAPYLNGTGCFGSGLFLAKWDGTGNVTWAKVLGGGNANRGPAPGRMACDSAGNLHMVAMGEFFAHESWDLLVGKWAPDGTVLRTTNQFVVSGIGSVSAEGLGGFAIDKQDNLYLSMNYGNGAQVGTNYLYTRGHTGMCVVKCDPDGKLDWFRTAEGPSQHAYNPSNLGLDPSGNVYLTGFFQDTLDFGSTTLSSRGTKDVFVAKLAVTPFIVAAPQSQIALAGKDITLTVAVGGNGPFEFQWLHDGATISGATNQALVLKQVGAADAGGYSVVVKNEFGQAASDPATLVINPEGVEIGLYSGLTIVGNVGQSYSVGYVTNVTDTNWISLTNLTLSTPSQFWLDPQPATQGKRFYLVKPLP